MAVLMKIIGFPYFKVINVNSGNWSTFSIYWYAGNWSLMLKDVKLISGLLLIAFIFVTVEFSFERSSSETKLGNNSI